MKLLDYNDDSDKVKCSLQSLDNILLYKFGIY